MQIITDYNKLHEENRGKFAVNGLLICADCGSTNTRLLEKGVHCNECQSFRISQKYYHTTFLQQIILSTVNHTENLDVKRGKIDAD